MLRRKINIIFILFLLCLLSCTEKECPQCPQERQSEEKILQNNKDENSLDEIAQFLSSVECKHEERINPEQLESAKKVLKWSELFKILEKNEKLHCFLKGNIIKITAYNYEVFLNDYCNNYPKIFNKCRDMFEKHFFCLKEKYRKKVFYRLEMGFVNPVKMETTIGVLKNQIFVDGETGDLIDELNQEIDMKWCDFLKN